MANPIKVQDLYNFLHERLKLEWLAGRHGRDRDLLEPGSDEPTRFVAGSLNLIHPNRVQVIGPTESRYLASLDEADRAAALAHLFAARPAAIFLVGEAAAPEGLEQEAEARAIPYIRSPLSDVQVVDNLQYFGSLFLAEKTTFHGVFLEVLGMGVLLTGESAIGKSELALELISRGSRLVADDAPEFSRIMPDIVTGSCPEMLRDFLEVRGLGIINIRAMFGDSAIKRSKYLRLIVRLARMSTQELSHMDRLSGTGTTRAVLGISVPEITIPVAPGRNLAILVESAVRNHLLQIEGYDAVEAFVSRQEQALKQRD